MLFVFSKHKRESDRSIRARQRAKKKANVGVGADNSHGDTEIANISHEQSEDDSQNIFNQETVIENVSDHEDGGTPIEDAPDHEDGSTALIEDAPDSAYINLEIQTMSDEEPEDGSRSDTEIDVEESVDNDNEEDVSDADNETDSSECDIISDEESDMNSVTNGGTVSDIQFYRADYQVPDCVRELESIVETNELEIGELQLQVELLEENYYDVLQENVHLKDLVESLQTKLEGLQLQEDISTQQRIQPKCKYGVEIIKNDDKATCFYTGIPKYCQFLKLFDLLLPLVPAKSESDLSLIDEFFGVFLKLRLGVPHQDIAYRLNVSESTVGRLFHKWLDVMSIHLRCLIAWPDDEQLRKNMPSSSFRKHYMNVKCIIDCFEIFIERPSLLAARAATYSHYKKHNTVKVFIAIAPTGSICFISKGWGGRVSDRVITANCGFLNKLQYGDTVMADRGFNIGDELAVQGVKLVIPAFTRGKSQLSKEDVEETRKIARRRIHVERVIGNLRKKYKILSNILPISLIKSKQDAPNSLCTIDKILIVTAALTNLCPSVVRK